MSVLSFSGTICATGPGLDSGAVNVNGGANTLYSYIRFENSEKEDKYLEHVVVPYYLDSHISVGSTAKYHIAEVKYPTPFGKKPIRFIYGIDVDGKCFSATKEAGRILRDLKVFSSIKLFLTGLPLLLFCGVGIIFIIQGFRVVFLSLPEAEMAKTLTS